MIHLSVLHIVLGFEPSASACWETLLLHSLNPSPTLEIPWDAYGVPDKCAHV